ncbi:response regulator [Candidatus Poribacteria bacterium]|nr:response regulator [Candidatus Poribacteria bacterium]
MINMEDNQQTKILIIDDEPGIHQVLNSAFQPDFTVYDAMCGEDGLRKIDAVSPDLVLLDIIMPRMSGMTVLRRLSQNQRNTPVIVFTGFGSIDSAVQSIKLGAIDYIEKPFEIPRLKKNVSEILKGRRRYKELQSKHKIIGKSPQIKKVWKMIEKYGPTDLPILLYGETGTGKELFARAIHEISKRSQKAFAPVDCSTLPETLFESEIFGYEKGAFTGADTSKPGQLDWAHKGTFFLDEISNLSLQYQAKLLRVIQERQYVPLGGKTAKDVDVRFISASNVDLTQAIANKTFRDDLYYRISGVCIELPPLRDRKGDIELLTHNFISKYSQKYDKPAMEISDEAMDLICLYSWPGNVRELEYAVGGAVVAADRIILPGHLPANIQKGVFIPSKREDNKLDFDLNFSCDISRPIDIKDLGKKMATEAEMAVISAIMRNNSMTQLELAKFLNLDPKTLRAKIKALDNL